MSNEELSKRVAELYGIAVITVIHKGYSVTELWLHDDSARYFSESGVEIL